MYLEKGLITLEEQSLFTPDIELNMNYTYKLYLWGTDFSISGLIKNQHYIQRK